MNELTIGQIWNSIFEAMGSIKVVTVIWTFNFFIGLFTLIFSKNKFKRGIAWFALVTGGAYLLALIITKLYV